MGLCVWVRAHVCAQSLSHVLLLATPWTVAHQASHPWDFLGKDTGVGCHFLQGIFLTQGLTPHLLPLGLFITAPPGKPTWVYSFQQIWEISSHYFFKYNFYLLCWKLSYSSLMFCFFFFFLCFILDGFYGYAFEFTNLFLFSTLICC